MSGPGPLGDADPYLGVGGSAAGIGGGPIGYDSVDGWGANPGMNKAVFACGVIKTVASVAGSAANLGAPGAGSAAAIGVGVVTDAITNGIAAYDTQKSVADLRQLIETEATLKNAKSGDALQLREIIEYCMAKRTSRRDRQISKAAGVGAGVKAFEGVKALHKIRKGTKGVARAANADALYALAKRTDKIGTIAQRVVQIIAGGSFDRLLKTAIKDGMKSSA